MFSKLLVANRGEIACRIIRTARALGCRTVAVYSDADARAPHVALADEAIRLGPPPAAESYLALDAVLAAARRTAADALHPGYGFLSERADFARACTDAGLVFVGPPAAAIAAMGDKAGAKRAMLAAGVPCAPGYLGEDQDDRTLAAQAQRLGFPLLVKAVAGGGGRGMRLVRAAAELPAALEGARREALAAFGDGTLMLERLIEGGRHIEIQVFADRHGHALHLGERDCTTQRRRQKLIEEAPSPVVSPALRSRMGADAVAAARAVGYVGAGTVEFIVDAAMNHFFLEMNTRLQVEHPVTECIVGADLVEWQLRIAAGEPLTAWLPNGQDDVRFEGHAIEARLYAEDPAQGFAPQTGTVLHWRPEESLPHSCGPAVTPAIPPLRIDHGLAEGDEVSPWYDAMVAKFVVHGRHRDDAIRRLLMAIERTPLVGPTTNARFLCDLLRRPEFGAARLTTQTIDEWQMAGATALQAPAPDDDDWLAAAAIIVWRAGGNACAPARPPGVAGYDLRLTCGGDTRTLRIAATGSGLTLTLDAVSHHACLIARAERRWRIDLDGVQRDWTAVDDGAALLLASRAAVHRFAEPSAAPQAARAHDPSRVSAPVAGKVAKVAVAVGERVAIGQPLVCVEAMKIEMWQSAGTAGTVQAVHAAEGAVVRAGTLLIELEPEAS